MGKTSSLSVACIQHPVFKHPDQNWDNIEKLVTKASNSGAELVLLQELHQSPYFPQTEDTQNFNYAETIPGPSTQQLCNLANKLNTVIVGSFFEKRAPGLYHNTALVAEKDGSIAGIYRKMHIPQDPGFQEKFYFTPGDLGFEPIQTSVGCLGVLVCWDQWFPEAARLMALKGADMLLYPTAIGWDPFDSQDEQSRQLDAWCTIQRSHAIANGIPILVSNRVGFESHPIHAENGIQFWGNSFIAGPQGECLIQAGDTQQILMAELDLNRSEQIRQIWPFFRDRRIDQYDLLNQRFDPTRDLKHL